MLPPPTPRAARGRTWAVAGVGLLYFFLALSLDPASRAWTELSYILFIVLGVLSAWATVAAARATDEPGLRRGLRYYAASHALTAIGNALWLGMLLQGRNPTFSWANAAYLLSYPLIVIGGLSFPRARHGGPRRWRLFTDGLIAVLAGTTLTWLLVVRPLGAAELPLIDRALLFAYPVGDLLIFVILIPFLLDPRTPSAVAVLPRLAAGQVCYLAGDLGYVLGASGPAWLGVDWPDVASIVGYVGMTWAMESAFRPAATPPTPRDQVVRSPVPFLLGGAVYLMLLYQAWHSALPGLLTLALVTVTVTLLILFRERFTEQENLRLTRELEATRSEARFRAVIEHLTVGVMVLDPDGRLRLANPAALALLGLGGEAVVGRAGLSFPDAIQEDGSAVAPEALPVAVAIRTRQPIHGVVLGVRHPRTGERAWLLMNADPSLAPDGQLEDVLCSIQDITERRSLEERLRQSQRMEAVGQLAGGIAHDFNNLLTAITGYTAMVQDDMTRGQPRAEDVVEIRKAAARAASLTQQLLAFGRRQMLQPVVLDINAVVRDAERLLGRLLGEDIRIVTRLAGDLAPVRVDRGQLEQVIVNLAVNARDAMPRGGRLELHTRNVRAGDPRLPASLEVPDGGGVLLQISDTGHGMDEATRVRAFEPFFTTKATGKGTGLGLSTVDGIVRQSGGDVRIESVPGGGTTVSVCLPRTDLPAPPLETTPVPPPGRGSETILVVEDEEALLRVTRRALEGRGYTVHTASSAAAARAWLDRTEATLDLLVTDVVMPGESGPELAAWVRRHHPTVPVLFISGYADEATLRYGLDQENAVLLPKPFRPEQLVARVRQLLDRRG